MKRFSSSPLTSFLCPALVAMGFIGLKADARTVAPPVPLEERLGTARLVFVGTVIERVEEGEWVRAVLRVDTPLRGVDQDERVEVVWRKHVLGRALYDAKEGQRGVAILDDMHEGRYWLRAGKFEPEENLDEIRDLLESHGATDVPTLEQWVAAGRPIPPGRVFSGRNPWFDEGTGQRRSDEEVHELLFGGRAAVAEPPKSRFPAHWCDPPVAQTGDLRPLPGGYGMGSGTLARWIARKMEEDARKADGPSSERIFRF